MIEGSPLAAMPPDSEEHKKLLNHLLAMIDMSQMEMERFYSRWAASELRLQAFIATRDYEQMLKKMDNDKGLSPQAIDIVVPYSYSAIHTMTTYLFHTFAGRKPIFQVGSFNAAQAQSSRFMETKLDYDASASRLVKVFWQIFWDSLTYGVGIVQNKFEIRKGKRTGRRMMDMAGQLEAEVQGAGALETVRNSLTTYEGNEANAIDPFMFFPDPRVQMCEVNKKGEFVFWRSNVGRMWLKKMEQAGKFMFVDAIPKRLTENLEATNSSGDSLRNRLSQGRGLQSSRNDHFYSRTGSNIEPFRQLDQGSVEIIPAEWGLGPETEPQKWLFSLGNRSVIIQAEPYDPDHGMHPVSVIEMDTLGSSFGQPGAMDFIGPLQDLMSWFVNSHVWNVNAAVNNTFVVDPSLVELQDLRLGGAGRIIRLKKGAYGQDIRSLIQQMQVFDVTRSHMSDMQIVMKMADMMLGVNENIRSVNDSGGRKSATEVRMSSESSASRLAARARLASAQGINDLGEQWTMNNLQYLSPDFAMRVLGKEVMVEGFMRPDAPPFDANFPIHDGTLPLDRLALLDIWRQIMEAVLADPELRMGFDIMRLFTWICELGGAQNIEQFQLQGQMTGILPMPDSSVMEQAAKGNLVPAGSAIGGVNALEQDPGSRLIM